ncbi:putative p44-31 outer membrane protein, silent [Anaplasma phagocytophilum str. ApMUC09]|uniref:Putative p44-31 outer membrane protein, silent n=1 Tax=Anaplasma phagocytophilum str. ApMUC09 TaxID=1359152 RepID=A0A0F3NBC5_ANAPH|nr:putative p44-31 outer membrane protein, silent [Anaplasma phagocytophilum str. ApMUC09]
MEISYSTIDDKICRTRSGSSASGKYGVYANETTNKASSGHNKVAVCGAEGLENTGSQNSPQVLRDFVRETLKGDGSKNWPTSTAATDGKPQPEPNDNAKAVAKDLVEKLSSDEKTIVAGLLAKTIEGGEVVEIRAVSSTSLRT